MHYINNMYFYLYNMYEKMLLVYIHVYINLCRCVYININVHNYSKYYNKL